MICGEAQAPRQICCHGMKVPLGNLSISAVNIMSRHDIIFYRKIRVYNNYNIKSCHEARINLVVCQASARLVKTGGEISLALISSCQKKFQNLTLSSSSLGPFVIP